MVNKIVFDYLSKYHSKYDLNDLKKKILSAGYSQQDIDEALKYLGLAEEESVSKAADNFDYTKNNIMNNTGNDMSKDNSKLESNKLDSIEVRDSKFSQSLQKPVVTTSNSGFKWIRFAGIVGILLILIPIIFSVGIYLFGNSFQDNPYLIYVFLVIEFILFIGVFFYLYGFVKMGKYSNSGLLKFAAKAIMILIVLGIILSIVSIVVSFFVLGQIMAELGSAISSGNFSGASNFNESLEGSGILLIILGILLGIFVLFGIVVAFCFAIGLMQAGREVRFAKTSGVLMFISLLLGGLVTILSGIVLPGTIGSILTSSEGLEIIQIIWLVVNGILAILLLGSFLFSIFALFSASRKFESN